MKAYLLKDNSLVVRMTKKEREELKTQFSEMHNDFTRLRKFDKVSEFIDVINAAKKE